MAQIMARYLPPRWMGAAPVVTFVPATAAARRRRGFDHAEHLARELSFIAGLDFAPLLVAARSRDQRKLGRTGRIGNMRHSLTALALSLIHISREVDKSLSGGEVKRIEIATILARDPKLAIYDEPEAGIDLWSFDRLTETFRDIHEARDGRSIVIISHQERIISLADEIVLLRDGQVAETGTPAELMPRLGFAARSLDDHGCPLSTPTELHLTEIPTTC